MPGFVHMDGNWFFLLIPMAVALAASLVLTPVVRHWREGLSVLAYPDSQRRFHPGPIPLLGGVSVYFALVAGLIAASLWVGVRQGDLAGLCWVLIPATGLACLFGAVDDCCNLRSRTKLGLQFLAALLIASAGFSRRFHHRLRLPHRVGLVGRAADDLLAHGLYQCPEPDRRPGRPGVGRGPFHRRR